MIEISIQQLTKFYGAKQVFANISLEIMTGDRIGLIGRNGCGKSTLLKILQGSEDYQAGNIQIRRGARIGFLDQFMAVESGWTVEAFCATAFQELNALRVQMDQLAHAMATATECDMEMAMRRYGQLQARFESLDGYAAETRLEMVLQGLDIPTELRGQDCSRLSGGEKTRVALARMLLEEPDILLLDEPSNHLDIPAVEWLEDFLKTFKGTVLMVSHDRCFLDRTVTRIIELYPDRAENYIGNYSAYVIEKERRDQQALRDYQNQQKKIERMEEQIQRFKVWAAMRDSEVMEHNVKVMERKLDRVERLERPAAGRRPLRLRLDTSRRSGNDVLQVSGLAKVFGSRPVIAGLDLQLFYQDRACLLGRNGCGKTTLLKLILGELPPDDGCIRLGAGLTIGYLPQEVAFDHEELTLLDWFSRRYGISAGAAWSALARALFSGEEVQKHIRSLSGGERSRLKLCTLCYEKVNLLIMDEPTNHLDIESREALENMLQIYEGTLLFVSHDRYFINKVADQILVLADGKLQAYPMGYDGYCAAVAAEQARRATLTGPAGSGAGFDSAGAGRQKQERRPAGQPKRQPAAEPDLPALEDLIEQAEQALKALEAAALAVGSDAGQLIAVYREKEALEQQLTELMRQWEAAQNSQV